MSLSTDVATLAAAVRRGLANGSSLTGVELRLLIDTLETLANTTESKSVTAVGTVSTDTTALSAALVTALAAWTAVGAGDSSTVYTTQEAILTPLRVALVASAAAAVTAAAASVTNVTVNDSTDGRAA